MTDVKPYTIQDCKVWKTNVYILFSVYSHELLKTNCYSFINTNIAASSPECFSVGKTAYIFVENKIVNE